MKIQSTTPLVDFKGTPIQGELGTVGTALATILSIDKDPTNRMKKYLLWQKLYQESEVTIDSADYEMIKSSVERSEGLANVILGQILVYLSSLKEEKTSE